jgi:signal transduction histidine kinase/ligand-binding sensor domain-containing protein
MVVAVLNTRNVMYNNQTRAWMLVVCVVLWIGISKSHAQASIKSTNNVTFERIAFPLDGMAVSITDIAQDTSGYMWFGTWRGLHRYDGYEIRSFYHDSSDSTSIPADWVETVYVDRQGTLWVGTYNGGLSRFDPINESFEHLLINTGNSWIQSRISVNAILEDGEGIYWIGTQGNGMFKMDRESREIAHYQYNPGDTLSLSDDWVRILYEDRLGNFWIGTQNGGLSRMDRESEYFERYDLRAENSNSLIDLRINSIYEDRAGTLWVGAGSDGLYILNKATNQFVRQMYDPNHPEKVSVPRPVHGRITNPQFAGVRFVHEDQVGNLWVGGHQAGIDVYSRDLMTRVHFESSPDATWGLSTNIVWTFFESRDGVFWLGTWEGLYKMVVSPVEHIPGATFDGSPVRAVFEDREEVLWIGTQSEGVTRVDLDSGFVRRYEHHVGVESSLSPGHVEIFHENKDGDVLVSTGEGLVRFDSENEHFIPYFGKVVQGMARGQGWISSLANSEKNRLWIGFWRTAGDVLGVHDQTTDSVIIVLNYESNPNVRIDSPVTALIEDERGVLWIGTLHNGLSLFDLETGELRQYVHHLEDTTSLSNSEIHTFHLDPTGVIWVGTSNGLNRFDLDSETFKRYTTQNSSLPENRIQGIVGDDRGNLWIAAVNTLTYFEPETGASRVFYDLQSAPFDIRALHLGHSGRIYVGGANGVDFFYPEELLKETVSTRPEVVISDIALFDPDGRQVEDAKSKEAVRRTQPIVLKHDQNVFTFTFAGLHYKNPENNQHHFMLEGYDPSWRQAGSEREAAYVRVPPGTYTFRVRATSSDGALGESRPLTVAVLPPRWRTTWAYGFYALLLAALVFGVDRWRRRHIVLTERERTRERELAQAKEIEKAYTQLQATQQQLVHQEKMASLGALTAGIAHEIKNPLNFITNFAGLNDELATELREALEAGASVEDLLSNIQRNSRIVVEHGQRADRIVQSMMRHASGATGERQRVALNSLVSEYVDLAFHGVRANRPGFEVAITREFDEAAGEVELVPQQIGQVLVNLFNNAFDAVEERRRLGEAYSPAVRVSTRRSDGKVEIRVADNGVGIPPSVRDKIFEPFFTTKPAGSGTGLGLSLSYEIVTRGHGGSLAVHSDMVEGTTFIITLPSSQ